MTRQVLLAATRPGQRSGVLSFVARELTRSESVLQAAWAKSNAGLLDRLDVDGPRIVLRRRDGSIDVIEKGSFRCSSRVIGSGRRLFIIHTADGRKIRLMEMAGMLSRDQWNVIADDVLGAVPSKLNRMMLRGGAAALIGIYAAAVTAGFAASAFGLSEQQVTFTAPLSLGLMAVWAVGLWFAFKRFGW